MKCLSSRFFLLPIFATKLTIPKADSNNMTYASGVGVLYTVDNDEKYKSLTEYELMNFGKCSM
jgi:hypothetical protein